MVGEGAAGNGGQRGWWGTHLELLSLVDFFALLCKKKDLGLKGRCIQLLRFVVHIKT